MALSNAALAAFFNDALDHAPVAFVVSTADPSQSRYLRANAAYLQLTGRIWSEINGADLVAAGAAVNSTGRQRRLWMLEHIGRYSHERATLRHASGRIIDTIMSAQRVTIDGQAVDVEYISEVRIQQNPRVFEPISLPLNTHRHMDRSQFSEPIKSSLAMMSDDQAKNALMSMLETVLRRIMSLNCSLSVYHPVSRFVARYVKPIMRAEQSIQINNCLSEDINASSRSALQDRLLDIATSIWTIALFQTAEMRDRLQALVSCFTLPPKFHADRRLVCNGSA